MSYFCVNHSDMKTTQDIIAILRHFIMTEGDRYGISRLAIFGSVARGEQTSEIGRASCRERVCEYV